MVNPYKSRGRCKSLFRRFFVIMLGVSALLLGEVYSVSAASSSSSSSSSEVSQAVGTHAVAAAKSYKIARDLSSIMSLDPTHYYRVPREPILALLYGSLRDFLADYSVEAEGKTHVLTLKPDLKFASGNPITAQDLAFTIKRAIRLSQLPRDHYVQFDLLPQNVEEKIKVLSPTQVQIEVGGNLHPDIFKAILFDGPAGCLLDRQLAEEKEQYAMTPTWLQRNSAGAGPYQLERFDKGIKVVLRRNPYYKHSFPGQSLSEQEAGQEAGGAKALKVEAGAAGQAKVKVQGDVDDLSSTEAPVQGAGAASQWLLQSWPTKVIFRHFPSVKGREKALQRGWVDQAYQVKPPKGAAQGAIDRQEGAPLVYRWENTYTLTLLLFNHAKPIVGNPWVRKAISQAIPYDTLAPQFKIPGAFTHKSFLPLGVTLEGQHFPHESFKKDDQPSAKEKRRGVLDPSKGRTLAQDQDHDSSFASFFHTSSYPDSRPSLKDSRYNLEEARRDLAKADLPTHQRPFALTLLATDEKLAKHLQRHLKKIGIQLSLDLVEEEAFFAKLTQHNFDLALMNWGLEYFHPHANAYACLYNAPQEALFTLASFVQWESGAISRDVLRASDPHHNKDSANLYKNIEKQFLETVPMIVLFQHGAYTGVRQDSSPPHA